MKALTSECLFTLFISGDKVVCGMSIDGLIYLSAIVPDVYTIARDRPKGYSSVGRLSNYISIKNECVFNQGRKTTDSLSASLGNMFTI